MRNNTATQPRYIVDSLTGYRSGGNGSLRKPYTSWQVYDSHYNYRLVASFYDEREAYEHASRLNVEGELG